MAACEEKAMLGPDEDDSNRPSVQQGEEDSSSDEVKSEALPSSITVKTNGLTPLLVLAVAAAVVGSSAQFGFNTGVINNPKDAIRDSFTSNGSSHFAMASPFTSFEMNLAVAIFAIGGMLGALPAGPLADLIGRKYTLLLNNITIVIGVALEVLAVHPAMFIIGRFVVGFNAGVNTVVVPVYVSEISPLKLRGSLGVLHQMAITSTILLSEILGIKAALGRSDDDFYGWRILFAVPLLFVIFQLATLPWCPESPKFTYIKRRREEAAIKDLQRLRGAQDLTNEIKAMEDELQEQQQQRKVDLLQFVRRPSLRRALMVGIMLHLSQQLCGIGGVLYYSSNIFADVGVKYADIATVVVGLTLVIFTTITIFLIETVGRRTLMLYGLGGMAVFFTLLTSMFCFQDGFYSNNQPTVTAPGVILVFTALGITAFFALGPGAIPWLMVSELFLQEARPVAVTIATIINWLGNFAVGLAFPEILDHLLPYGTVIFTGLCLFFWSYLYIYLPETKGRSVENVTMEFRRKTREKEH